VTFPDGRRQEERRISWAIIIKRVKEIRYKAVE
jgi:hypothetical protein